MLGKQAAEPLSYLRTPMSRSAQMFRLRCCAKGVVALRPLEDQGRKVQGFPGRKAAVQTGGDC